MRGFARRSYSGATGRRATGAGSTPTTKQAGSGRIRAPSVASAGTRLRRSVVAARGGSGAVATEAGTHAGWL